MKEELYYDDEIDLREIVLTLLKGWKVILLMTVLIGVSAFGYSKLQPPVYEATATILVDQNSLALKRSPASLFSGDEARQLVADKLEIPVTSLPSATIANDKTDTTLFTITVQSANAQQAANIVNAWADTGLGLIDIQLEEASAYLDMEITNFEKADLILVNYLGEHELSSWTWADLSVLTGVVNSDYLSAQSNPQELPEISDKERLEITQLMRARVAAEQAYDAALKQSILIAYDAAATPPAVLSYARTPTEPISPKTLMNIALGLVLGSMLGVFGVFVAGWWRNSAAEEERAV
jgi:capsular polysaccharide biosynthesis protein